MPASGHPLAAARRIGQVISIDAGPPPTVELAVGGDTSVTLLGCPYLDSYYPIVGDYVVTLENQGDYVVLGKVATGTGRIGLVKRATGPSSQTDYGTSAAIAVSVTCSVIAARWYRVNAYIFGSWITADGIGTMKIIDGTSTGGAERTRLVPLSGSFTQTTGRAGAGLGMFTGQAGSTGSLSWSIQTQTTAGALRVQAGDAVIWVEDLGT
jgi:hypothetical protein